MKSRGFAQWRLAAVLVAGTADWPEVLGKVDRPAAVSSHTSGLRGRMFAAEFAPEVAARVVAASGAPSSVPGSSAHIPAEPSLWPARAQVDGCAALP